MQAADSFLVDSNCLILKYLISNYLSVKTFVLSRAKIHKEREIFITVCCVKCTLLCFVNVDFIQTQRKRSEKERTENGKSKENE